MKTERDFLLRIGMPESVARKEKIFGPSSVGVIVHTGEFEAAQGNQTFIEPNVLLVRQADQVVNGYHPWGIPAGRAFDGEGILQVAKREGFEETGIKLYPERLRWFCLVGDRKAILSYGVNASEIQGIENAVEYELGIKVILPANDVDTSEIDRLALVPVEVFGDHMLTGSNRVYRRKDLLEAGEYLYYPESHNIDQKVDFILYKTHRQWGY